MAESGEENWRTGQHTQVSRVMYVPRNEIGGFSLPRGKYV